MKHFIIKGVKRGYTCQNLIMRQTEENTHRNSSLCPRRKKVFTQVLIQKLQHCNFKIMHYYLISNPNAHYLCMSTYVIDFLACFNIFPHHVRWWFGTFKNVKGKCMRFNTCPILEFRILIQIITLWVLLFIFT